MSEPLSHLKEAIERARLADHAENGKCCMCNVGDQPDFNTGLHRGKHQCGNNEACILCQGCLPPGEICSNCFRKNVYEVEC